MLECWCEGWLGALTWLDFVIRWGLAVVVASKPMGEWGPLGASLG